MKLTKKHIIGIVLLVAVAVALWYFVLRKKPAVDGMPAVNSADQGAYDALFNLLNANISSDALNNWLGDIAKEYYSGKRAAYKDYLINGQLTKTGALLAAFASSYYGNAAYEFKIPMQDLNNQAYKIFYDLKGQTNRL